jgi:hypothetical protein
MKRWVCALVVLFGVLFAGEARADDWVPPKYWTCKIHFVWTARFGRFGRVVRSKSYVNENSGVPGSSSTKTLHEYYGMLIVHLARFDLARGKNRSYLGMVGACWRDGKPSAPLGWPKAHAW